MLRRGKPGSRFVDRYEASRRKKNGRSMAGRVVRMVIAVVAFAIGIVLMFIPGPAIVFFFIAGSLFAAESRGLARGLDWTEVKLRKFASWLSKRWRKLSTVGKVVVTIVLLVAGAGAVFLGYRVMFG